MTLSKHVAFITGACGDIGRATALALAREGVKVAINDIVDGQAVASLVEDVQRAGSEALYLKADTSNREDVDRMVREAWACFGRIDICVGNAGIVEPSSFLNLGEESWLKQLAVNLTGCFHIGQSIARTMVQAKIPGKIIFTSSWVQDVPWENLTPYCVSKSGLKMLAKCMALELARHNITVNVVAPGFVDAGLSGKLFQENPGLREEAIKIVPLGRIMSAMDVAEVVLFLCSHGAGYMTGSTLLVDGGNSLFMRSGKP